MAQQDSDGGTLIRSLRQANGWSIKTLAEKASVNYVFLSKLERGIERPSEELITRLAKTLDYGGDINQLVAAFGKVPREIEKLILDDPNSVVDLPAFFKSRKKSK